VIATRRQHDRKAEHRADAGDRHRQQEGQRGKAAEQQQPLLADRLDQAAQGDRLAADAVDGGAQRGAERGGCVVELVLAAHGPACWVLPRPESCRARGRLAGSACRIMPCGGAAWQPPILAGGAHENGEGLHPPRFDLQAPKGNAPRRPAPVGRTG